MKKDFDKIGFLASKDLHDRTQWSGTICALKDALAKEYDIVPIVVKDSFFYLVAKKTIKVMTHKQDIRLRWRPLETFKCQRLVNKAAKEGIRLFFAPAGSTLISDLKMPADTKLIYLSDTTYHAMINYYYWGGSEHDHKIGNLLESKALAKADAILHSSSWARRDAMAYYGISPEKIHVVPFGANLKDVYVPREMNEAVVRLLFCGVDWERKGADIALECVKELNRIDPKRRYTLTVLGLNAPKDSAYENVTFIGRLNKNHKDEYARILEYYQNSDLFILPTKAECSAIVFAEAAMFALPAFTHLTGGTADYVQDGITGRCLPLGSTGTDFAYAILEMFEKNLYQSYSMQARKHYIEKLNWDAWLAEFKRIADVLGGVNTGDSAGGSLSAGDR